MRSVLFVSVFDQLATAHILNGCLTALSQGHFTYQHDQILHCLASGLSEILSDLITVHVYADLRSYPV